MATLSTNPVSARAHTNIALIKYWGKRDEELIIPYTSSLSLTLDHFYTDTTVQFKSNLSEDQILIDGQQPTEKSFQRVHQFLGLIRKQAGFEMPAVVQSVNHVPTAAGLASSASAFAALAAAGSKAAGLQLSPTALSRLARRGSGSACRSIFGGFAEWQRGEDDLSSYARPLFQEKLTDIRVIALTVARGPKSISSRQGMKLSVDTSPYYPAWVKTCQADLERLKVAIDQNDFSQFGRISELNAMRMHALTLSADPDFTYFNSQTLTIMNLVKQLRHNGVACYYTIDAGPNVKVLCQQSAVAKIAATFSKVLGEKNVIVTKPGPGVQYL
ncbi:diphosphomevalonate decarboxylase [Lentilactobacillus farraginis]|uniref:diphosphomevalonate decarboxylase n=1 Tax=Lentilactobacillus farraginis DSM 18382 = JCM 14108 TaxID=1423743 RepID=X0P970_9LACO|nr:diphosphomevalonate decarboxylase [Lentilactobacillus farraginis]KRM07488.1 diphosphomevalonate decarboxylase [Lentilactobacillus farraginis DSM 18382 = JCM 14108]GAF35429.1 diphosphomevalonate decarboxylase [Lentilactobacillus farraginis DSM 18382 = JCM 14108]